MLELLVAALIQVTVLTSGTAPATTTAAKPAVQTSAAAPGSTTNIGTSGWDDRN